MSEYDYDMLVIGSGTAGHHVATQAAKLEQRVALVERSVVLGGVMINTGTIPSKTLREAALYLSGYRELGIYGESYVVKQDIKMQDLLVRTDHVMQNEVEVTRHQLMRNRVELLATEASFVDSHAVKLEFPQGQGHRDVTAATIIIAVGTVATMVEYIPFDGQRIFLSDGILYLDKLPRTLTIVGSRRDWVGVRQHFRDAGCARDPH